MFAIYVMLKIKMFQNKKYNAENINLRKICDTHLLSITVNVNIDNENA